MVSTIVRLPVVAAIFAAAVALLLAYGAGDDTDAQWSAESQRAAAFLAATPAGDLRPCQTAYPLLDDHDDRCFVEGFGDPDHDGYADCWRATFLRMDGVGVELDVWPGCAGSGFHQHADDAQLVPPALSQRPWPQWIAELLVGPDVSCVDPLAMVAGCAAPDAAWQWWLETTRHDLGGPWMGVYLFGRRTPDRQTGPLPVARPRALVLLPGMHDDVLPPPPDPDAVRPAGGARIVFANLPPTSAPPSAAHVACAGLDVRTVGTGLIGVDTATGQWSWLLVDPSWYKPSLDRLACLDGLVFGYGRTDDDPTVTIVDPRSGGWQIVDRNSCVPEPRPPVRDFGDGERTYLGEPLTAIARRLAVDGPWPGHGDGPRQGEPVVSDSMWADTPEFEGYVYNQPNDVSVWERAVLVHHARCAGWSLSWSRNSVLGERGTYKRWLTTTYERHRITDVRCEGTRAVISWVAGVDALAPAPAVTDRIVIDLVNDVVLGP
jgi:hypothetical protein